MATPVSVRYKKINVFWLLQSFGDFLGPFVLVMWGKVSFFFHSLGVFSEEGDRFPELMLELPRFVTRHPLGKAESCKAACAGD